MGGDNACHDKECGMPCLLVPFHPFMPFSNTRIFHLIGIDQETLSEVGLNFKSICILFENQDVTVMYPRGAPGLHCRVAFVL